jgi:hypothetical protein
MIPVRRLAPALLGLATILPLAGDETVSVEALCFPRPADGATLELLVGGEKVIGIPLQSHEFTLPVQLPRLAEWRFGESGTDAQGGFTFTPRGAVTPLPAKRQLLIFIRKGAKDEDGFEVIALNPAKIEGRHYVLLNLTHGPVAGVVGGEKVRLPPGRRAIVAPAADRGEDLCFAGLQYRRDDKWRPFFSSNWRLRPNARVLVIIHQAAGWGAPRLHTVVDPL